MSADMSDMDIDNQSEDGEIKKSPSKDMGDYRYYFFAFVSFLFPLASLRFDRDSV